MYIDMDMTGQNILKRKENPILKAFFVVVAIKYTPNDTQCD